MADSSGPENLPSPDDNSLRIGIDHVVRNADKIAEKVDAELPGHPGLQRAARGVASAARQAETVSQNLSRFWNLHRMPVVFVGFALTVFGFWIYWQFFHVATLSIATPDKDSTVLRKSLNRRTRVEFVEVTELGSRKRVARVEAGNVDLAFIQGGIPVSSHLLRLETPGAEQVLYFVRDGVEQKSIQKVLTSYRDQGSHSVAMDFARIRGWSDVRFEHRWDEFLAADYTIGSDIDAVFVVKDPTDEVALNAAIRLQQLGFVLTSPRLGVRESQLDYLTPVELPTGHLNFEPPVPPESVSTYAVSTFLVAREGLTPRLLAAATHLLDSSRDTISHESFELTVTEASELLGGIDAFLGILITIGLAFLALMGVDVLAYRRRFNELNSLISLISMHQSSCDLIGEPPEKVAENVAYLSLCADLVGLIGVLTGYYAQENSSLLYNNLSSIIPERCDALRLNIQLKILHATIALPVEALPEAAISSEVAEGRLAGPSSADDSPAS
ncbi:MAG: hypothetical protein H8E37_10425 [Planctomycetes bacterium]|nr:hypothetical protein [Planctomycetota bacterium]